MGNSIAPLRLPLRLGHVLVLGLLARLVVFFVLPDQGFPDASAYRTAGRELVETGVIEAVESMPLYPLWVYLWGGGIGAKLADIGLSIITVWLVYQLTMVISEDRQAAMIAALGASVYPHFLFYAVSGLTETAYLALVCGAFLALYRERYILGIVLITLSILVRPTLDLLAPLLILTFVLTVHRRGWAIAGKWLAIYASVYVILLAPWWVHNYYKYDAFVRLSLGDGIVLYSGNNPLNTSGGGVNYTPGEEGYEAHGRDRDMTEFQAIKDRVARNEALKQAAFRFIADNPGRFIELAGIKFVRFWRLWPYAPKYEKPLYIAVSVLSYGVVLALCIWFCLRYLPRYWRRLSPVLLFTAYLAAVHTATIASIRYRLPLEPFMLVIAAWTAVGLLERWRFTRRLLGFVAPANSTDAVAARST